MQSAGVVVPERIVPVPTSVSQAAQAFLAAAAGAPGLVEPDADDKEGWRALVAGTDAMFAVQAEAILAASPTSTETILVGPVPVTVSRRLDPTEWDGRKAHLYIHGGALVMCGGAIARAWGAQQAEYHGGTVYSVDYRMPPDHPYPTPLEDCLAVYRHLLSLYRGSDIVISGASAGGNLTAALALKIRDLGLPPPAAIGLMTPELDLTESGDTFQTNLLVDVILRHGLPQANRLYANGHDLADPYLSPLFADFTKGYPPTFIQAGTRDLFLSNAVRLHRALRRAGVPVELHVWEAMPHGGFGGETPEDAELRAEFGRFLRDHWGD
jgi:acetyl esterase/lipase